MAATGFTPISLYYSSTASATPTAGNLVAGELAINTADGKLFYKDSAGVVQVIGTKGGVGSSTTTQVLYNSSGLVVGSANLTFNGTTLTVANDASISGLTVGKGGGSVASSMAVGYQALNSNTTGSNGLAIGYQALYSNTTYRYNHAVGYQAGYNANGGEFNNFFGWNAGYGTAGSFTGGSNCGFGLQACSSLSSGTKNIGFGNYTLNSTTTGSYNVAIGDSALYSNTTASGATALGYQAGYSNTTSGGQVFIGYQAGKSTTGNANAFVGYQAGFSNTTGVSNVGLGYTALYTNSAGSNNVAIGQQALYTSTGDSNVAVGYQAMFSNTSGGNSIAIGQAALYSQTTGPTNNIGIGLIAGYAITSGQSNLIIGHTAGNVITTGNNNVCLGYAAGSYSTPLSTGGQNVYIGTNSGPSSASVSYEMVITTLNSVGKGSSTGYINANGGGVYQGNNAATWSITSDARLKKNIVDNTTGLDAISQIQVRNFEYRTKDEVTDLPSQNAIEIDGVQLGAIAQELKEILPDCVKTESTGVMSVDTTNLTWYLINAVKELNAEIIALKAKVGT